MSDDEKDCSDKWLESLECMPSNLKEAAGGTSNDLLPSKSKEKYEFTYDTFVTWKRQHKTKLTSESIIMAYFNELSKKYKPSTLWSIYFMLKSTVKIKENIDIDKYHAFKAFMKKQSSGFKSKKSNVLSSEDVHKFLAEAPNNEYLVTKVALVFGICGACRSHELVSIKLEDIRKQGDLLVVNLSTSKTNKPRTFVIGEEFTKIVNQYADLRPKNAPTDRFFLNYRKSKCINQVIGIHKFSKMPQDIAVYLNLENPNSYTGDAFRRTSATMLADSGANITTLKRHGGWKSDRVAEGYIKESKKKKSKIGIVISTAVNFSSAGTSKQNINAASPKRQKIARSEISAGSSKQNTPSPKRQQVATSEKMRIETVPSETVQLEAQPKSNIDTNLSTGTSFVFNNCSVVIKHTK